MKIFINKQCINCFISVFFFLLLFAGCKKEEEVNTPEIPDVFVIENDYMPLRQGNTWYYTLTAFSGKISTNDNSDEYVGAMTLKLTEIKQSGNIINYSILQSFSGRKIHGESAMVNYSYIKTYDTTTVSNYNSTLYLVEYTDSNKVVSKNEIYAPFFSLKTFNRYGGKNSSDTLDLKPSFAISGLQRHISGLGLTEYSGSVWHFNNLYQIYAKLDSVKLN